MTCDSSNKKCRSRTLPSDFNSASAESPPQASWDIIITADPHVALNTATRSPRVEVFISCTRKGLQCRPIQKINPVFFFFFSSSGGWGKNKAQAHHTSTYFQTRRVSIKLKCLRNPALAGVFFGSHYSDSVSCPCRPSSLLPQRRKLPLYTDA